MSEMHLIWLIITMRMVSAETFRNWHSWWYFTSSSRGIGISFQLAITAPLYSIMGYCIATAQSCTLQRWTNLSKENLQRNMCLHFVLVLRVSPKFDRGLLYPLPKVAKWQERCSKRAWKHSESEKKVILDPLQVAPSMIHGWNSSPVYMTFWPNCTVCAKNWIHLNYAYHTCIYC